MIRHVCSLLFPRRRLVGAKFGLTFSLAAQPHTVVQRGKINNNGACGPQGKPFGRGAGACPPFFRAYTFPGWAGQTTQHTHTKRGGWWIWVRRSVLRSGAFVASAPLRHFPHPSSFEGALTSRYLFSCQYFRVPLCQIGACSEVMMEAPKPRPPLIVAFNSCRGVASNVPEVTTSNN